MQVTSVVDTLVYGTNYAQQKNQSIETAVDTSAVMSQNNPAITDTIKYGNNRSYNTLYNQVGKMVNGLQDIGNIMDVIG